MLWVIGQTGCRQVDCSRVVGRQQQISDRRQWQVVTDGRREDDCARLEVDERSRPWRIDGRSATYCSWPDKYWGAVPWRAWYAMTASLNLMCSSQWKLARALAICSEWRRPAIDWAATLRTDWRRLSREARRLAGRTFGPWEKPVPLILTYLP